jgi:hypothetical protein
MWKTCDLNPNEGVGFDDEETKEMMKNLYDECFLYR